MKKYLIFDLDDTLIESDKNLSTLIISVLCDKYKLNQDEVLYFLHQNRGVGLREQIMNFMQIWEEEAGKIANEIYDLITKNVQARFFDWIPEKIKELSQTYKLYLSTGNSTAFAEKKLKEAGIYDCFEYVLGSDVHLKWTDHIEIFKDFSTDENFEKDFIFIGDGQKDREIAKTYDAPFIHIDPLLKNEYNDIFEIKSVAQIDSCLEQI